MNATDVDQNKLEKIETFQSENFSTRVRFIIIHYTSIDWENSLKVLTQERYGVSSHYLIPEDGDETYQEQVKIYQLVDEEDRAWHAGGEHRARPPMAAPPASSRQSPASPAASAPAQPHS